MSGSVAHVRKLSLADPFVASLSDELIGDAIEIAARQLTPSRWPNSYPDALGLLALHLLASTAGAGSQQGAGPVQSERMGSWAKNYAVQAPGNASDADLSTTSYGRRFLRLRSEQPFIRSVV